MSGPESGSHQTLCWREVDSNFQYAGTGESRHPSFVPPIAWDELARARVLLGSCDLTREEISVTLIHRDRLHGLKEPARDPGGASVGVALPDDLDSDRHAFDR